MTYIHIYTIQKNTREAYMSIHIFREIHVWHTCFRTMTDIVSVSAFHNGSLPNNSNSFWLVFRRTNVDSFALFWHCAVLSCVLFYYAKSNFSGFLGVLISFFPDFTYTLVQGRLCLLGKGYIASGEEFVWSRECNLALALWS